MSEETIQKWMRYAGDREKELARAKELLASTEAQVASLIRQRDEALHHVELCMDRNDAVDACTTLESHLVTLGTERDQLKEKLETEKGTAWADGFAEGTRKLREQDALVAELKEKLETQVSEGPTLHSNGGEPFALTFRGQRWVPQAERDAAIARAERAEEQLQALSPIAAKFPVQGSIAGGIQNYIVHLEKERDEAIAWAESAEKSLSHASKKMDHFGIPLRVMFTTDEKWGDLLEERDTLRAEVEKLKSSHERELARAQIAESLAWGQTLDIQSLTTELASTRQALSEALVQRGPQRVYSSDAARRDLECSAQNLKEMSGVIGSESLSAKDTAAYAQVKAALEITIRDWDLHSQGQPSAEETALVEAGRAAMGGVNKPRTGPSELETVKTDLATAVELLRRCAAALYHTKLGEDWSLRPDTDAFLNRNAPKDVSAGQCPEREQGYTPCTLYPGHKGSHRNGTHTWDAPKEKSE